MDTNLYRSNRATQKVAQEQSISYTFLFFLLILWGKGEQRSFFIDSSYETRGPKESLKECLETSFLRTERGHQQSSFLCSSRSMKGYYTTLFAILLCLILPSFCRLPTSSPKVRVIRPKTTRNQATNSYYDTSINTFVTEVRNNNNTVMA